MTMRLGSLVRCIYVQTEVLSLLYAFMWVDITQYSLKLTAGWIVPRQ